MKSVFLNAINGWIQSIKERNMKIHIIFAVIILIICIYLDMNQTELCLIYSAICMVLISEMLNTSIEGLCDLIDKNYNKSIEKIKDVSAGAVLLSVVYSLFIGYNIIFLKIIGVK